MREGLPDRCVFFGLGHLGPDQEGHSPFLPPIFLLEPMPFKSFVLCCAEPVGLQQQMTDRHTGAIPAWLPISTETHTAPIHQSARLVC
jgi:hypothetical protein